MKFNKTFSIMKYVQRGTRCLGQEQLLYEVLFKSECRFPLIYMRWFDVMRPVGYHFNFYSDHNSEHNKVIHKVLRIGMRIANFAKTRNQITKCEENFNTMKKQGVKLLFAPKLVEKGVCLSIVLPLSQSIPMASFYYL